ncbi:amidase domain-containing protein [Megamonas funiformis]|jgi:hypothetical protein|uniref:amidase domain-containing protein n=1 Tax=Megamonas funiformis TaxID=437897 RepID=UPI000E4967FC|nr:amidase domain-containing protein [Megamonas funiformis]RHG04638.1 hypothetical protein DW639_10635 [Megamonas funiformis]
MNTVLNRKGAIEYAEKWYDSHNPDYVNYDEGEYQVDCTNFVSQCWHEGGGIDMSPLVWTGGSTTIVTTDAWVNVDAFAKYMTELSAGYDNLPIAVMKWDSNEVSVGDIVQFYNKERGGWHHSAIITYIDPVYGLCYTAHSDSVHNKPLSDVYPHQETEVRFICPRYAE